MFRYGSPSHSRAQRGFPIRTPWDHSPVIDSPRLIADSYVLLRLLMPRHPPCALKNLTTKIKNKLTRENHENQPHLTMRPDPGSNILEIASYTRCSRPLCSSQTTTPHHTPHTHNMHDRCSRETRNKVPNKNPTGSLPVLLPQDPTVCQTLPGNPGPTAFQNNNPTKEKVRTHRPARATRHLFVDIPPMSTRHGTFVHATGLLPDNTTPGHTPRAGSCRRSLERR